MSVCILCEREFKSNKALSTHLRYCKMNNDNLNTEGYYRKFLMIDGEDKCKICGGHTTYNGLNSGYLIYCAKCGRTNSDNIQKWRNTLNLKFENGHPMRDPIYKDKFKSTMIKKYGCEHALQNEGLLNKMLANRDINIMVENYKESCMRRYGVSNPMKLLEFKSKVFDAKRKKFFNRLLNSDRLKGMVTPLFDLEDYKDVYYEYPWKCNKCDTIFKSNLDLGCIPRCPTCFPKCYSKPEFDIFHFCEKYFSTIIQNDRTVLDGKEIDILIPEKNIGIELDGLYWHSESMGTPRNYHQEKTSLAEEKGIHLIHIFEDEWFDKQDIVKSILLSKFGEIDNKIYARECDIKKIDNSLSEEFLFNNHLQGPIPAIHHHGLFFQNELVLLVSFGKARFNKDCEWEILRFCNKKNTQVLGGLSKLISHFIWDYEPNSIITYVDARYGDGKCYKKCGFEFMRRTQPGYFYTDGHYRSSRLKYQKHKLSKILKNFDSNLTEWENMQLNGFDRIWDCGNYVYEWRKN